MERPKPGLGQRPVCLALALLALTASCGPALPPLSDRYEILSSDATGKWAPITDPVVILADNQTQHLYGDPFWMRSEIAAQLIRTAVRPLQLDLYGQDLLRWVLDFNGDVAQGGLGAPVIHLGDALNFSCEAEMTAFFANMSQARVPWLMAPGNHDGYFFGVQASSADWPRACRNGGRPIDHSAFIERYLRALQEQFKLPSLARTSGLCQRPSCVPGPGAPKLLDSFAWSRDPEKPWHSFVVQLLDLTRPGAATPTYALLLDTSEYDNAPILLSSQDSFDAGEIGSIRTDQLEAARRLLRAHVPSSGEAPLVVLMGHHPYGVLTEPAKRAFDALFDEFRVVTYVSAHTHTGQYFVNASPKSNWLELNLGSVLDWSPEYRLFALSQSPDKTRVQLKTEQNKLETLWDQGSPKAPIPDAAWEAKPSDPRYYLTFLDVGKFCIGFTDPLCSAPMQAELMRVALNEFRYSLEHFPTTASRRFPAGMSNDEQVIAAIDKALAPNAPLANMIQLAQQLQAFDAERAAADEPGSTEPGRRHADYRLWQALWASMRMQQRTRKPEANQGVFVFPVSAK